MVFIREVGFVWRQLGWAFFGALTPVGALFVLKGVFMSQNMCPICGKQLDDSNADILDNGAPAHHNVLKTK